MRQSILKVSALLAVVVAACSEPTSVVTKSAMNSSKPSFVVLAANGSIQQIAGNNYIAAVGATPFDATVRVVLNSGGGVAAEPVTFTGVATNGVAASHVGFGASDPGTTTITVNTDANGYATVRWFYAAIGGQTMTATVGIGGVSTTFTGIATTSGAVPTIAATIGATDVTLPVNSGLMAGQVATTNPVFTVTDAGSAAKLKGVTVNLSTVTNPGSINNASPVTDANGQASAVWTLGPVAGATTLQAGVSGFTGAGAAVSAATMSITAQGPGTVMNVLAADAPSAVGVVQQLITGGTTSGSVGTKNPVVQIKTATGAVAGANIVVRVVYGTGSTNCTSGGNLTADNLVTDASGTVATKWCNTLASAGTRTLTFTAGNVTKVITATITADNTTAFFTKTAGDLQTGTVGTTVPADPVVTVKDGNGLLLVNQAVTFTANTGTISRNGVIGQTAITANTDANGQVAVRWTLGTSMATQTLTATATAGSTVLAPVTFTATTTIGTPTNISIVQGNNQTIAAGTIAPRDPTVQVTDQYGNVLPGTFNGAVCSVARGCVYVTFAVTAGGGTITNAMVSTGQSEAGRAGTQWTTGATAGTNTVTATLPNGQFVTFTVTTF